MNKWISVRSIWLTGQWFFSEVYARGPNVTLGHLDWRFNSTSCKLKSRCSRRRTHLMWYVITGNLIYTNALNYPLQIKRVRVVSTSPWKRLAVRVNGATGLRRLDSYIMQAFTLMGETWLVSRVYIKGGWEFSRAEGIFFCLRWRQCNEFL